MNNEIASIIFEICIVSEPETTSLLTRDFDPAPAAGANMFGTARLPAAVA